MNSLYERKGQDEHDELLLRCKLFYYSSAAKAYEKIADNEEKRVTLYQKKIHCLTKIKNKKNN